MKTLENVLKILDENNIEYNKIEHEPVRTSQEAADIRGVPLKSGVKVLLLKTKKAGFIMCLLPADQKLDNKKITQLEGKFRFATSEEVLEETGCEVGGVPPFGHTKNGEPNNMKTYMDEIIFENKEVNFNAGDRRVSVTIKSQDLKKIVDAVDF